MCGANEEQSVEYEYKPIPFDGTSVNSNMIPLSQAVTCSISGLAEYEPVYIDPLDE